jgi:hypothetical protein
VPDIDPLSAPDFTKLADRFAASLGEIAQFTILKTDPFKLLSSFVALVLSIPIALFAEIAVALGTVIEKTLHNVNPQIAQLASLTLSEVFDQEISLGAGAGAGGTVAAETIGKQLLAGILGIEGSGTGAEVAPGFEQAEKLMGTLLGVPIRGFLLETVAEIGSLGQVKLFHELVEDVQGAIGSGRLARVALQPAIKAAIATPAEWAAMKSARPTLLPESTLIKAYNRGHWAEADVREELARRGYNDTRIDEIINDNMLRLTTADVALLYHRAVWQQDEAIAYLQDSGWDTASARLLIQLPALATIEALNQQLIAAYDKAYLDWFLDDASYLENVRPLESEPLLADLRLKRVQFMRQNQRRDLTLAELNSALSKNVIDLLEWRTRLQNMGFQPDDITVLELTQREIAASKEQQAQARADAKQAAIDAKAAATAQKAADAAAKKDAADAAKKAIQDQREAARVAAAAAAEQKRQQAAAAALALTQARQAAEQQKLVDEQTAAALRISTAANIQQQAVLTQSLADAQTALDTAQAASDKAQLQAQLLADEASAAVADATSRAALEQTTIETRRAERIAAFQSRLALVDEQEASGLLTANAAQKQRDHLNELEKEAEAAEQLDELAIQKSIDQAKSLQGAALQKVAAAAAQAALLPTAAQRTQQQIAAAAAGKAKLSADVAASKLAADAKISAQRIASFQTAAAEYDKLLQDLETQRAALQAKIDAGTPPPPTT